MKTFADFSARRGILNILLWPLSCLYAGIVTLRRYCYQLGLCKIHRFSKPIIVIGNITVGGTGKTPLTIALAQYLQSQGLRVGLVSRGYGGSANHQPTLVVQDSDPLQVGDEPLLMVKHTGCPMVIAAKRPAAIKKLLADFNCDVVLSDDGLQHYAMARDIEIVVINGEQRLGNGWYLPAGPLRESAKRLHHVDWVVSQGQAQGAEQSMAVKLGKLYRLDAPGEQRDLADFSNQQVHAVAAIGNPDKFFKSLLAADLLLFKHVFADHHYYRAEDLHFSEDYPIIMTEKDAVKCQQLNLPKQNIWVLPIRAQLSKDFYQALLAQLNNLRQEPCHVTS